MGSIPRSMTQNIFKSYSISGVQHDDIWPFLYSLVGDTMFALNLCVLVCITEMFTPNEATNQCLPLMTFAHTHGKDSPINNFKS